MKFIFRSTTIMYVIAAKGFPKCKYLYIIQMCFEWNLKYRIPYEIAGHTSNVKETNQCNE